MVTRKFFTVKPNLLLCLIIFFASLFFDSGFAKIKWHNPSQPFSLDCGLEQVYSATPRQATYTWSLNDTVIHSGSEPTYVIQKPSETHVGEWRCQISFTASGESILSHRVSLRLAHWQAPTPAALQNASVNVPLNYGRTSLVTAAFDLLHSQPPPSIEWFDTADGGSISLRHRPSQFYITQNGSLVIFEPKHALTLRAVASNKITGDQFIFFVSPLLIEEAPMADVNNPNAIFLVRPNDVSAIMGEAVTFECIPRSNDMVVEWFRVVVNKDSGFERQKLTNSMQFQISKNRGIYLTINYVQLEDQGEYQCVFRGDPMNRNATARLTVLFSPVFPSDAIDREQLIDLDSSVSWSLSAVGSPAPNSTWFFNGRMLHSHINPDPSISILDSGGLALRNVRLDHSGFYQCIAENQVDESIFTIHVQVRASPPQILSQSADKTIQAGDSVSFSCRAIGAPQPRISWSHNGRPLDLTSGHIEVLPDGQLLIRSANVSDEGRYTCFAINSRGNASIASNLRVMTKTRIVLPPQNNSAQIGSTVQFYCSIQSDPRSDKAPLVTWYRNRVAVDVSGESRFAIASNNSLLISQIRSDDGGNYECRVESNYGSDSKTATLTVLELPFPPIILNAQPLAPEHPRAVRLLWSPGFDGNSPILNYIVEKKELLKRNSQTQTPSDLEWNEIATFQAELDTPLEGVVNHLLPSRTYAFRVRARNSLGAGNPSAPSANVTLPAQRPSGPPQSFVANSPSNSSIVIQWQPPAIEDQNGDISSYWVRYRLSGYNPALEYQNISDIGAYARSHAIEGLIPHKQYDVSMAAVNEKGLGVFSRDEIVWTRQGRPSVPPRNVDAKPVNSTAVEISWSQPDPQKINGILSQYHLVFRRVDYGSNELSSDVMVVKEPYDVVNPQRQHKVVGNLAKYANYSIQLGAETEGGLGPLTELNSLFVRTLEDTPDAPASLKIVDNIDTSMTAVWSPPDAINGILTQYVVEYAPKASSDGMRKMLVQPDVNNVTLSNLQHDTLYTVRVSAATRVGTGQAKVIDIKSGVKPELADPPTGLVVLHENLTSSSAVLTFKPGNDRGSPVFLYHVETLGANGVWLSVANATPYNVKGLQKQAVAVTKLHPFTNYQFRLFPINAAGRNSISSEKSELFRTSPSIPANIRAPVLVRAVNSTCLVVKWSPLNGDEWHGTPSHYLVEYRAKDQATVTSWSAQKTSDSTLNALYVTGLKPWTHYDIRVTAWNQEMGGSNQPTQAQTWRTWESSPSGFPLVISATARNSSCISASWRELPNPHQYANGILLGYKLQASQLATGRRFVERIPGNKTLSGIICGLDKYTEYAISVAAFTRMGDGPFSNAPFYARTGVDLPDPPSRVYFSQIGDSFVEIWWDEPAFWGADEITGYRLRAISEKGASDIAPIYYELQPSVMNFTVAGLKKDTQYKFMVGSRNAIGWSSSFTSQLVYTFSKQVEAMAMTPPTQPLSVAAKPSEPDSWGEYSPASITISWRAPFDAYLPIRNYTLQYQKNGTIEGVAFDEMMWHPWREEILWNETSFVAKNLDPGASYRFRLYATNDAGFGSPSDPTFWTQPSPSPPLRAPEAFQVKPIRADTVEVQFAASKMDFGVEFYDVLYCRLEDFCIDAADFRRKKIAWSYPISDDDLYKVEITNLEAQTDYEFRVEALNKYGAGPRTEPPQLIYVGDVVPSIAPGGVKASLIDSSSACNVTWTGSKELQSESLIGYRVMAVPRRWVSRVPPPVLALSVPDSQFSMRVSALSKYTQYAVSVAAMSLGGDGPPSVPVLIETPEDIPTAPADLRFTDILLDAVTFRWSAPANPNGNLTVFEVQVEQQHQPGVSALDSSKLMKSVKVQVPGDQFAYTAQNLIAGAVYKFTIRAATSMGFGPSADSEVKTEPPPNAPVSPKTLQAAFLPEKGYVRLTWQNPRSQNIPMDPQSRIVGYLVDVRRVANFPTRDSGQAPVLPWIRVFSTDSPYASTQVALDVLPSGVRGADVQFRVAARSQAGQSWFSEPSPAVYVPRPGELAAMDGRPYYLQHWFLGLIALGMLLVLTVLIASLIVSGYRRRHHKTSKQHAQLRHGVVTGEHRRSNGFANGRPTSHLFGRDGPDGSGLNPVTSADLAAANGAANGLAGAFGVGLRGGRHNMYNSSIHSRTSRSRRPRSPPRPSLAGYEPSDSAHSASTSVIGGPVVPTANHFSVVPSATAIASELASITGAKQRLAMANGGPGSHLMSGGQANSAMLDDFSASGASSSPVDGDDDAQHYTQSHLGGQNGNVALANHLMNEKASIPTSDDMLNDSADMSVNNAHSTFHSGQAIYGGIHPSTGGLASAGGHVPNYASTASIRIGQQVVTSNGTPFAASTTTSFGYATTSTAVSVAPPQIATIGGSQQQQQALTSSNSAATSIVSQNTAASTPLHGSNPNAGQQTPQQTPSAQFLLNNVAGNRQPLTGFSSFV